MNWINALAQSQPSSILMIVAMTVVFCVMLKDYLRLSMAVRKEKRDHAPQ